MNFKKISVTAIMFTIISVGAHAQGVVSTPPMQGHEHHGGGAMKALMNSTNPADQAFVAHIKQEREAYRAQIQSEVKTYMQQRKANPGATPLR